MLRRYPEDDNPFAASDIISVGLEDNGELGILTVTLHEATGFPIPDQFQETLNSNSSERDNVANGANSTRTASPNETFPYAMLDFDKSVALVNASSGTTQNPLWVADASSFKFDVFNSAELTVRLYIDHPNCKEGSQDVFLGSIVIKPAFAETQISTDKWFQSKEGTGKMRITVVYTKKETLDVGPLKYNEVIGHGSWGDISAVTKEDSNRLYALKEIPKSEIISCRDISRNFQSQVESPFITPVTFLSQVCTTVCLFSPVAQGGHLFNHLQKAHHFDIEQSTFYAAEILCALEAIHEAGINYNGPKPKNILLDSLGHIALCDFTLFSVEKGKPGHVGYLEYPAPEMISNQGFTKAEKWWALGVILYEMLTGLPPFYDADVNEVYRKILFESVQVPNYLSIATKDILAKLLTREPEKRLGVKGVSEIKAHAFFNDIDWEKLAKREDTPPFKPNYSVTSFAEERPQSRLDFWNEYLNIWNSGPRSPPDPNRIPLYSERLSPRKLTKKELFQLQFIRRVHDTMGKECFEASSEDPDLTQKSDKELATPNKIYIKSLPELEDLYASSNEDSHSVHHIEDNDRWEIVENEGWKLLWDSTDQAFHFHNHFTNAKERITTPCYRYRYAWNNPPTTPPFIDDSTSKLVLRKPTIQEAKHDALEAILKRGYRHLVPQLLQKNGMDVNIYLFTPGVTPLYYAVKLEDVQLAKMFLDAGAEPNMKTSLKRIPLVRAVEKRNEELTELLVQSTDGVNCTLALGQAVRQQAVKIVNILLANGVKCDFEEWDRPTPPVVRDNTEWCSNSGLKHQTPCDWFMPPLVYAVKKGNKDLVQRLLAHGADVNIGYHDFGRRPLRNDCGRPIQLAMKLKHHGIVQLLLDFGADVCLAQPTRRSHSCETVSREEHLEITAALMDAAVSRNDESLKSHLTDTTVSVKLLARSVD